MPQPKRTCLQWTSPELSTLRKHYESASVADLLLMLPGRTYGVIKQKAKRLGLSRSHLRTPWTEKDDATICQHYPHSSLETLLSLLPRRSLHAIRRRASDLGVVRPHPWMETAMTPVEIKFIRDNYGFMTTASIAAHLGRSFDSVRGTVQNHHVRGNGFLGLAFRRVTFARECGWPEDLYFRQLQILNAIAVATRPLARQEIAGTIQLRWRGDGTFRTPVQGTGPRSIDYIGDLVSRGLVIDIRRHHLPCLYLLSPHAMSLFLQGVPNDGKEEDHDA